MASTNGWLGKIRNSVLVAFTAATLVGCGTSPVSGPTYTGDSGHQAVSPTRHEVVRVAGQMIGTPYRYGGNNRKGFDCSGLVQYAYRKAGVDVPRTTASQLAQARVPERRNLLPGDLLFFEIDWQKSRHVGIYEGDGVFIHAPSSGKRVSRASLENPFWGKRLIATRTFL
jgi:cell wall-associated NlpC family hydrolase